PDRIGRLNVAVRLRVEGRRGSRRRDDERVGRGGRGRGHRRVVTYRSPRSHGSNRAECGSACDHLEQPSAAERQPVDRAQVVEKIGKISAILACHHNPPLVRVVADLPRPALSAAAPTQSEVRSSPAAQRFSTTWNAYVNALTW